MLEIKSYKWSVVKGAKRVSNRKSVEANEYNSRNGKEDEIM